MTAHSDSLPGFLRRPTAVNAHEDDVQTSSTTGGSLNQEPVVVWEAANHMEAQIVKGRLESENIPALIRGEALGQIYGFTSGGLAATDVLVPAPLAEKAIDILNTEVEWVDADEFDEDALHTDGEND